MRVSILSPVFLLLAAPAVGPPAIRLTGEQTGKSPVRAQADVQPRDLLAEPVGADWTSYNGDYTGRRFSSLRQINTANVARLRAAWVFHSPNSDRMEVTPLVFKGAMYITSANDAFALDARTGRVLWRHQRATTSGLIDDASAHHNRGVGLWHDRLFMETDNAHLLCLDARSGHLLWDVAYAQGSKNYGATSAPLVVKDEVVVGTSGGDDGVRGFVAAFDTLSGKMKWRFWTIPGPGEFGSASWPGKMYLLGGGTTWMPGAYDPELNTIYWCTSNPSPDFDGSARPGDDLYTDCVLALDPDTGTLKWYFQFTPHDLYDYDATETPVLVDVAGKGASQRLLVQANRNGFLYALDRATGKFLKAARFAQKMNWATGIDSNGRPIPSGLVPTAQGTRICPSIVGATNWYSPSYNPETRTLYFLATESCEIYTTKPQTFLEGETYYASGTRRVPGERAHRELLAYSIPEAKLAWRYPLAGDAESWGGTMTTAGGLVFFGDDTEAFEAVDVRTAQTLWHFNTGQSFSASPMTYAVDGLQYVAIAAGSDVFAFSLPQ